jgi:hypothetical protein
LHDDVPRYVGKGLNGRWSRHLSAEAGGRNPVKGEYFIKHQAKMTCMIIAVSASEQPTSCVRSRPPDRGDAA